MVGYPEIGNVDSIHNSAGIINEMGGSYYHKYTYDNFNRISTAHGSWTGDTSNTLGNKASNYTLEMAYENMHRITTKQQGHIRDGANVGENTYDNLFKYEDVNHPNAVTSIENQTNSEVEEFNYDDNDERTISNVLVGMKHDSASSERTRKRLVQNQLKKIKPAQSNKNI